MTAQKVTFDVVGLPAPKGSKTVVGGRVIEGASATGRANVRAWVTAVAETARDIAQGGHAPLGGPLGVTLIFGMPRPRSRAKGHHGWHATKPDIDKLVRATLDGLKQGGLIADDSLVAMLRAEARETDLWTGAVVTVEQLRPRARTVEQESMPLYLMTQ